jgi:hypothetical protein
VRSGETLRVHFERRGEQFENVWLEGSARMLFQGDLEVSDDLRSVSTAVS